MMLLIDIGNTRIKWATLADGALGEMQALAHAPLSLEELRARWALLPAPQRVLASNVAGERLRTIASDCARECWGEDVRFVQSAAEAGGVRNAYRQPEKLGVDRWLAMIAAHRLVDGPACIVSVGTAMTIDALAADGRHLGGVITPGPDLMVQSLFSRTSDIAQRATGGEAAPQLFADNTLGAVEQGAVHALAALIERACDTTAAMVHASPAVLITGGAGASIAAAIHRPSQLIPDLVLRGLAVLAGGSEQRTADGSDKRTADGGQ